MLLALVLFAAGCGTASGTGSAGTSPVAGAARILPDAVHVLRTSRINHFRPLDVIVGDYTKVRQLYTMIRMLPPFVSSVSCPMDTDLEYHMTFFEAQATVATVTFNAEGCKSVALSMHDLRDPTPAFVSLFATTIGIPESDLFVQPLGSPPLPS